MHTDEAEQYDRSLGSVKVRVDVEATGSYGWFRRLLSALSYELLVGDAAQIRASNPRKQKTDKRDAEHILSLLVASRFPAIWQPPAENEQLRQLLMHLSRMVRMRTRVINQLDGMAKNEGLCVSSGWSQKRRQAVEVRVPRWSHDETDRMIGRLDSFREGRV